MSIALCYHAVSERWPAALSVTPAQLADHLSILASHGYRGVTLSEAVAASSTARVVAITFDDAYRSVIELAHPILADAGFEATVFAPTDFIGSAEPMSWPGVDRWLLGEHRTELTPMSWDELVSLADSGWEVGSHTCSHPRLPELEPAALDAELRDSKAEIETRLARDCRSLAYPYGVRDQRVVAAARRAGYEVAARLGRDPRPAQPLDWPRMFIDHSDNSWRFRLKVSPLTRRAVSGRAWRAVTAVRRRLRS